MGRETTFTALAALVDMVMFDKNFDENTTVFMNVNGDLAVTCLVKGQGYYTGYFLNLETGEIHHNSE
jgi:hypothetical protein